MQRVDTVFLFDVDNTLLDNDRIRDDLRERLQAAHGDRVCARYWEIMDELWDKLGYMDYLGALERLRLEEPDDFAIFHTANWLLDYPFADRLYPHALDAVKHVGQWGCSRHSVRRRRRLSAAQDLALGPVGRVRRQGVDLHP